MKCWVRACKFNENGECKKYKDGKELLKDFENGGGCALTVSVKIEARMLVNGEITEDWNDLERVLEAIRGYYSLVCDSITLEFRRTLERG